MPVEVVIVMSVAGTGRKAYSLTERHIHMSNPTNLLDIAPAAVALANARNALNGSNVSLNFVRFSRPGVFRDRQHIYAEQPGGGLVQNGGVKTVLSDWPDRALQIDLIGTDVKQGRLQMGGIPDDLIKTDNDGDIAGKVAGWRGRFQNWQSLIQSGDWGFRCRDNPPTHGPFDLVGWKQEAVAPFRLICTITNAQAFAAVGDVIQIRNVVLTTGRRGAPTGQFKVVTIAGGVATTDYTLSNSQGFDATQILQAGTIESVSHGFQAITFAQLVGVSKRKRGATLNRVAGRSRPRRRQLA